MAKKTLSKRIDPYLTQQNVLIVAFGLISLLLVAFFFFRNRSDSNVSINEDQIRMERNGEIITINKNGLVEYRAGDKVTYKIWDSDKVGRFFNTVENKARGYLEDPDDGVNCVYVSLYLDGELVTICFSEDDEIVKEAYEEFEEEGDDTTISLSDLFDDDEEEDDDVVEDISDLFNITPTPTLTPTSTPGGGSDDDEEEVVLPPPLPVEATCESWEEQIVGGRAIISNTLCSVTAPEE